MRQSLSAAPEAATRRCRADGGQVGGAEVLPFGVLVFVVGGLLVVNAWAVVDAKFATDAAAHAAVRAYAEAPDAASAQQRALAAAADTAAGFGRSRQRLEIEVVTDAGFGRCARVRATARYQVPALTLPWIGGYGDAFEVSSIRSELVDPYRSGLPGSAAC